MPTTIGFEYGDVVLIPFPFTDQTVTKKRPAVGVSSASYHRDRRDIIVMAVTGQTRRPSEVGEVVVRKLGSLQDEDRQAVREGLRAIFG